MSADAAITVALSVSAGRVAGVDISSTRPVTASRVLRGRAVEEALMLLPALFALCGRAQRVAALQAVEQALGVTPDPTTEITRTLTVSAEIVQEAGTAVLTEWAQAAGEPPDMEAARHLRTALQPVGPRLDNRTLDAALDAAERLDLPDADTFDTWLADDKTDPARALMRHVETPARAGFGAGGTHFLPALTAGGIAPMLAADTDGAFRAAPTWRGRSAETGPLSRRAHLAPVAARVRRYGSGLSARIAARLLDLRAAADSMRDAARRLWHHAPEARAPAGTTGIPAGATGCGTGVVETGRGTLAHWVDIADGRVRDWRILAPTEWNFHPDGALAQGVLGAPDTPDLLKQTRLLALALDPCVPCTVTVA